MLFDVDLINIIFFILLQTMRVCYTIVNVMTNCKKEKLVQQ